MCKDILLKFCTAIFLAIFLFLKRKIGSTTNIILLIKSLFLTKNAIKNPANEKLTSFDIQVFLLFPQAAGIIKVGHFTDETFRFDEPETIVENLNIKYKKTK
jgi:hypothetical protein